MKREISPTLLAATLLWFSFSALAIERPHLIVRYYDQANVNPRVLDKARQIASHVFEHADVTLDWQDGCAARARCEVAIGRGITVVILSSHERMHRCSEDAGGCARRFESGVGGVVYILSDRAEETAHLNRDSVGIDPSSALALVLGHYMAHEIGHLLLRDTRHSIRGLMMRRLGSNEWWVARKGKLAFTPDEAAIIHRHLPGNDER